MGNVGDEGETGSYTLEEALEIQRRRIEAAEANPSSGSGTPYLDASGVVGASVIAAAVFGGIAGAFLSLEVDQVNTQQWEEDKLTSLFSYFIIIILRLYSFLISSLLIIKEMYISHK